MYHGHPVINTDPEILGVTPVFYSTRVPVKNLFDYLEAGKTIDYFPDDFEGGRREQAVKMLQTSSGILQENIT